ncbi:MAG: hypothetical protein DUD27_02845 [Lachnospiraceae bacterium]|nr:MAG: hypothetical protein DUD27_02845 [Lachnospiraceae bacterium]
MSFDDFSNRDVNDSIDEMFDYNHDGELNSSEQANVNAYRERIGSRISLRRGPYGILVFFLAVYSFMLMIESISNYDAGADQRERAKDMKAQREEFENAQTVNYFYDDGTESDEDNSYDDKYNITSEDDWYYYFDDEE